MHGRGVMTKLETGTGRFFGALVVTALVLLLGACSQPGGGGEGELNPFYLNTHSTSGTPLVVGPRLAAGVTYVVTVEGTHSSWSADEWEAGVCKGESQSEPMYPSPGTANGPVGMDAAWIFAIPVGSSRCGNAVPYKGSAVRMSLDGGASFVDLGTITDGVGPSPDHSYEYIVTGQGKTLVMNRGSGSATNNYGRLYIEVRRATAD